MGYNDLDDLSEFGEEFAKKPEQEEVVDNAVEYEEAEVNSAEFVDAVEEYEEPAEEVEEVEEYEEPIEEVEEVEEYEEPTEEVEEVEEYEEPAEEVEEVEEYQEPIEEVEEVEEYQEPIEEVEEVEEYEEPIEEVEEVEEYQEPTEEVEEVIEYVPIGYDSGIIDEESACVAVSTIDERMPFKDRLKTLGEDVIAFHRELQAFLISYQGVKSRYSIRCDSYRVHRELLAKMAIGGKTLKLYLAVNPEDEFDLKINQRDLSEKRAYEEVPFMLPIRSQLSVRKAKKIIAKMMKDLNIQSKFKK